MHKNRSLVKGKVMATQPDPDF